LASSQYTLRATVETILPLNDFPSYQDQSYVLLRQVNTSLHTYFANTTSVSTLVSSLKQLQPVAFKSSTYRGLQTTASVTPASTTTNDDDDATWMNGKIVTKWMNENFLYFILAVIAAGIACIGLCSCCWYCCRRKRTATNRGDDGGAEGAEDFIDNGDVIVQTNATFVHSIDEPTYCEVYLAPLESMDQENPSYQPKFTSFSSHHHSHRPGREPSIVLASSSRSIRAPVVVSRSRSDEFVVLGNAVAEVGIAHVPSAPPMIQDDANFYAVVPSDIDIQL
jgi:hypothetical protein